MEYEENCRTCLRVVKGTPAALTDDIYKFLSQDLGLQSVPKEHPKLRLPQILCSNCNSQIIELQQFLIKCRDVETFFKSKLEFLSKILKVEEETKASDEMMHQTLYIESVDWKSKEDCTSNLDSENEKSLDNLCSDNESVMDETVIDDDPKPNAKTKNKGLAKDCSVCGKHFRSVSQLRDHENIHKGIKPYCCDICGMCFTQRSTLVSHQTLHSGKPIECEECGRKFARKSHLIQHDRMHRGEKPFACDMKDCKAKFRIRAQLLHHQATHTGIRNFRCDICGHLFFSSTSLRSHTNKVHPKFSYQCDICLLWFSKPSGIRKHMDSTHEIQLVDTAHLKKPRNENTRSLNVKDEVVSE